MRYLPLFIILWASISSTAEIVVDKQYVASDFSGVSIGGQRILVLPLFVHGALDTSVDRVKPAALALWAKKHRRDLRISADRRFEQSYLAVADTASLVAFYRDFGVGDALALQTSDSVWNAIGSGYLMAIRVRNGAAISDFNGDRHSVLLLEAELWRVRDPEAVWRIAVTARSSNPRESAGQFAERAVHAVFEALPVAPYNENGTEQW